LIISGKTLTLVGAPWAAMPALERYGYSIEAVAVIMVLSSNYDQIAGLLEIAAYSTKKKKPTLAVPAKLIGMIRSKLEEELGSFLEEYFDVKIIAKLHIKEEYHTEIISFVPNFMDPRLPSYGLKFENAKVFISGETKLNESWLFREMDCSIILHSCGTTRNNRSAAVAEIQELPGYLQNKIWLYGYDSDAKNLEQPFPMLYLPPGSWIYDSERRDKILSKERFIRENSRKQV